MFNVKIENKHNFDIVPKDFYPEFYCFFFMFFEYLGPAFTKLLRIVNVSVGGGGTIHYRTW